MPSGNVLYNVSFYRMLSASQVSNSHPILKLKFHSAKEQDKNKIKCMSRQKTMKKKDIKILKMNSVFTILLFVLVNKLFKK